METVCRNAQLIRRAAEALPHTAAPLLLALDGRCAAGKTTLAARLQAECGWEVVHLDDFFLQPQQRTPQRLAEPGGNLDRERLIQEVLYPLQQGKPGSYRVFDCHTMAFRPQRLPLPSGPVVLLEGSYACHPALWDFCALHIFLTVDPEEQLRRLARRSPEKLDAFRTRWIPMEERYFAQYDLPRRCDLLCEG